MIKGAIFDVDGTILDSMAIWEEAGERYLQSIHVEAKQGLSKELAEMTIEEAALYMKQEYHLSQNGTVIVQGILDTVRDFYYNEAPLKAGVKEVLEELQRQGIPMVIATSSEKDHVEKALERLEIKKYFDKIFTCSEIGSGKTRPDIYEAAARYMETEPQEIIVFEDVIHALRTAKKAGFQTVAIYDRFSENDQEKLKETADIYLSEWPEWNWKNTLK
ncbi:MAG: HAD family hydrolase [Dorea sp.]